MEGAIAAGHRLQLRMGGPGTPALAEYVLLVVHCILIQAHAAGMGEAGPRLLSPGTWSTKGPEQATQEGGSEQPQRSHGRWYLGGGEHRRCR